MAREDQHFRLRIPDTLKGAVEVAAAKNKRSMTAEIVDRLEASFSFDLPRETRHWLEDEGEASDRTPAQELLYRLDLTRRFDLDVGEFEKVRSDAGPVADYIDSQMASVRSELVDLKYLLLSVIGERARLKGAPPHPSEIADLPSNVRRGAALNAIEVTDDASEGENE